MGVQPEGVEGASGKPPPKNGVRVNPMDMVSVR